MVRHQSIQVGVFLAVLLSFVVCPYALSGQIMEYEFKARINQIQVCSYDGFWEDHIPITGSFYYETNTYDFNTNPDLYQSSPYYGQFGLEYSYKGESFKSTSTWVALANDMTSNKDRFNIGDWGKATETSYDFDTEYLTSYILLVDNSLTVFDSADSCPVQPLSLADFDYNSFVITRSVTPGHFTAEDKEFAVWAELTELTYVPEPATALLFSMGGLALLTRRRP